MNHITAADAAADLESLMETITREDKPVFITRPSGGGVVVISHEEWLRNHMPDVLLQSWEIAKEHGLDQMTMEEIDEEIAAYRRETREAEAKAR